MKGLTWNNMKHIEGSLKVFSGDSCFCDVGMYTGYITSYGHEVELHTGDIVLVWHGDYLGTDVETWTPLDHLTIVVANQYQSFTDGSITTLPDSEPFVMGIRDCGFADPAWKVQLLKSHKDVIEGEHWKSFGFSYKYSKKADEAMKEKHATR
jgi:hypothetical protein